MLQLQYAAHQIVVRGPEEVQVVTKLVMLGMEALVRKALVVEYLEREGQRALEAAHLAVPRIVYLERGERPLEDFLQPLAGALDVVEEEG